MRPHAPADVRASTHGAGALRRRGGPLVGGVRRRGGARTRVLRASRLPPGRGVWRVARPQEEGHSGGLAGDARHGNAAAERRRGAVPRRVCAVGAGHRGGGGGRRAGDGHGVSQDGQDGVGPGGGAWRAGQARGAPGRGRLRPGVRRGLPPDVSHVHDGNGARRAPRAAVPARRAARPRGPRGAALGEQSHRGLQRLGGDDRLSTHVPPPAGGDELPGRAAAADNSRAE